MRKSLIITGFALTLALPLNGCVTPHSPTTKFTSSQTLKIEAVIFDYFHGAGEASAERLNRAFATEHAKMAGVYKNKDGQEYIKSFEMSKTIPRWAANKNPAGSDRDGEILHIEIVDERIAVVTFRYTDRFYDAFTLVRVNDDWKIVGKAFVPQ